MENLNPMEKFKQEESEIRKQIKERTLSYMVAALGLVAGLAWNEAIKSLIDYLFPLSRNSVWAKLIYAVFITIVIVLITVYLMRFLNKKENKK